MNACYLTNFGNGKVSAGVERFSSQRRRQVEELWVTDGTAGGTRLMADLVPGSGGSAPSQLVLAGTRLFFSAVTEETGCEPCVLEVGPIMDLHA